MSQHSILLLGSGFVAKPCAEYVLRRPENRLTVASRRLEHAQKLANSLGSRASACTVDVDNEAELDALIQLHDLVISLIPYTYHPQVIRSALKFKKHVVTTSYISPAMAAFDEEAKRIGVTVMNEIGLDPGIDHLYAVKVIDEVHRSGGSIKSFVSYCGGLPAPECSNNPLGYKFSWSSRGVLMALRNTAKYIDGSRVVEIPGPELMKSAKSIPTGFQAFDFVGYPNRDSTPYAVRYSIPEAETIIRGTLRYRCFPMFAQALVDLGLLDDGKKEYLSKSSVTMSWRQLMCRVVAMPETCDEPTFENAVKCKAKFDQIAVEGVSDAIWSGFKWLQLFSTTKMVDRRETLLDTLCATLEEKMMYQAGERDLVMLQHRFVIETREKTRQVRTSTLLDIGTPNGTTSMAKTVGLPCGMAVQLILDGKLQKRGVLAPMTMDICQPFMDLLEKEGIHMVDEIFE